jgi:SAM-dependent methyltransferase
MSGRFIFDQPHYDALNKAREDTIRRFLASPQDDIKLQTAVDVGCGLGHFSSFVANLGFKVLALDGRQENVIEARRRFPGIEFLVADAEDHETRSLGKFDLVLCLGLLYHLENPFAAIRNLFAMTGRIAILEGMCIPGDEPMLAIRDEGPTEDQGLQHVALYPTENGLIKLLYRSGYPHVFRFQKVPEHSDYSASSLKKKVRTILVAATVPLSSRMLLPASEPITEPDPWMIRNSPAAVAMRGRDALMRIGRFALKPWPEKQKILQQRWTRLFPS